MAPVGSDPSCLLVRWTATLHRAASAVLHSDCFATTEIFTLRTTQLNECSVTKCTLKSSYLLTTISFERMISGCQRRHQISFPSKKLRSFPGNTLTLL